MLTAEERKILKSVNQIREEQECYKAIDPSFLSRADIEYIFETYYHKDAEKEDLKNMRFLATSMYEALFTWQYIFDFNYPAMECRKRHHEPHLEHLKRRLIQPIIDSEYQIRDLFKMNENQLKNLREQTCGRLA